MSKVLPRCCAFRALALVLAQSPPDLDSPPSLLHNAPTPLSLRHGLGDCGRAIIPPELWSGLGLPLQLPRHPACPTRSNAPSKAFLSPLVHSGVIFRAHSQPAAPAFAIYKSAEKARLIVDLRRYNTLPPPPPPPFHLPHISSLLATRSPVLFFIKLDVANLYWSLLIPPTVSGYFSYQSASLTSVFGSRRLPFGWSYSPVLAHPGEDFAPSCPVVPRLALTVC